MSEYYWGIHRGKLDEDTVQRVRDVLARKHPEVTFIQANIPGTGWQSWFAGPNRGEPFDSGMQASVNQSLEDAGVVLP